MNVGLTSDTSEWEAVGYFIFVHILWLTTKAKHWELFVMIVSFEDRANLCNGLLVRVDPGTLVPVQTSRNVGIIIGSSVVNCNCEIHLPPTSQVINESRLLLWRGLHFLNCICPYDNLAGTCKVSFQNLSVCAHNLM